MRTHLRSSPRGAALVIILLLTVLLSVLVLAYFSSISLETQSASVYSQRQTLNQLSRVPQELVKSQILAATTLGQTNSLATSTNVWTSQPGLLRVYDRSGSLARAFKLYSAGDMETEDINFIGSEIPSDWNDSPERWVDLNAPVPALNSTSPRLIYPILNPNATTWSEGFTTNSAPGGSPGASMPVEWLYVLRDGAILSADDLTSAEDVIGRIAFWTDDESCKVNINTAGERTMWDRPRAFHEKRETYARNQPSSGEYQAYPGHPATVSLSAVMGKKLDPAATAVSAASMETLLSLTPRYRWGGSENASRTLWETRTSLDPRTGAAKKDRLYASLSEINFSSARTAQAPQLNEALPEADFLLTESSRAPELNRFGLPRIGLWPLATDPDDRTVYDRLIARATTVGDQPFYFQRADPLVQNEADSGRNAALLGYLDTLTSQTINGFGGSFETKWGTAERRQILTEMFDYIRAGVNLSDTSRPETEYARQFTPATDPLRGFVAPTKISAWNTRGLGRTPILNQAGLIFYAYNVTSGPPETTEVHALLWFNFFSPMHGLAPYAVRYRLRTNNPGFGLRQPAGTFQNLTFRNTEDAGFYFPRNSAISSETKGADWGGYEGMMLHAGTDMGGLTNYAFHTGSPVSITGNAMEFRGGSLTVDLIEESSGTVLQSYVLDFPDSVNPWPTPILWEAPNTLFEDRGGSGTMLGYTKASASVACDVVRSLELRDGDARIVAALEDVPAEFFQPGYGYFSDSLLVGGSMLFMRGQTVSVEPFNQNGTHVNVSFKSSKTNFERVILPTAFEGQPIRSLREVDWAGDFDNGFLGEPDGPYANKPDEGHTRSESSSVLPYQKIGGDVETVGDLRLTWDPRLSGFFSPTRQMPSAIMFGSLPTTVTRTAQAYQANNPAGARPWETLLFNPVSQADMVPDSKSALGHPGRLAPPDHLLLDYFTMPVVEPYALSEPFSTAGKINLNQRLIPFNHITRETGLHAALKNLEFTAIRSTNSTDGQRYRSGGGGGTSTPSVHQVDVPATVAEITKRLDPDGQRGTGIYRSASEICEVPLIPKNLSTSMETFWQNHQLTGDNSRESPYNALYPLFTTQSNTYRIHYRVQTLQKPLRPISTEPAKNFLITGEQRGSYLLERTLDVNDPRFEGSLPSVDPLTHPLNEFYHFRLLRHSLFTPRD